MKYETYFSQRIGSILPIECVKDPKDPRAKVNMGIDSSCLQIRNNLLVNMRMYLVYWIYTSFLSQYFTVMRSTYYEKDDYYFRKPIASIKLPL